MPGEGFTEWPGDIRGVRPLILDCIVPTRLAFCTLHGHFCPFYEGFQYFSRALV
jgi:hypothetical protein